MSSKYLSAPVSSSSMPKGIPYIIGNEAAERFSFYGMKGILVIFMTQYLFLLQGSAGSEPMSNAAATANYHYFTTAVYFTPIFGALIADILLGKFLTIMLLSTVYCVGHGVLAFMGSTDSMPPGIILAIGLILISVGSGGIKPCVSAHVGDQFGKQNANLLEKVFGWFYFSINTGAFLSTMLTPWLLEWYGPHLAFGIPGVLMAIATLTFWMGRNVFIHIPPGGAEWFTETFSLKGLKAIVKLSSIFIFIAVFWALFDQTGSSWVLQAEDLDRNWLGMNWLSSQIQAVNPIMILIYIPIFQFLVYPLINKVWTLTPVRKISLGLFVMVAGFAMVGTLQSWIDQGDRPSIGWQVFAYAVLTASEVMVSITGLEFAYTQAPKKMKSVIMALFLMSVALGNLFTAIVNNYIMIPDRLEPVKSLTQEWRQVALDATGEDELRELVLQTEATFDRMSFNRLDDGGFEFVLSHPESLPDGEIRVGYGPDIERRSLVTAEVDSINKAIDSIGQFWDKNDRLPLASDGQKSIQSFEDPWGNQLHYRLINRSNFEISSNGPDQQFMTKYDVRAIVEVLSYSIAQQNEIAERIDDSDMLAVLHPAHPWIDVRRAEIDAAKAREQGDPNSTWEAFLPDQTVVLTTDIKKQNHKFDVSWEVGGATKLNGAAYFEFFTWLMLGTAISFVVVAYFYKPKTYIQE